MRGIIWQEKEINLGIVLVKNSGIIMIEFSGNGISQESAAKFRKFAGKMGYPKVARCRLCGSNVKNFSHMGFFELKPYWDFGQQRLSKRYVGVCMSCIWENDIKHPELKVME